MSKILFSTINVTNQVFYRTSLAAAFVNLKPLVPGHVLVIPTRLAPRMSDLSDEELGGLMSVVRRVGKVVENAYNAKALTIACQDGPAAGQSVPHVHFHILPRGAATDPFAGEKNDEIYPALQSHELGLHSDLNLLQRDGVDHHQSSSLRMDAEERQPRSMLEMEAEAKWLSELFKTPDDKQ